MGRKRSSDLTCLISSKVFQTHSSHLSGSSNWIRVSWSDKEDASQCVVQCQTHGRLRILIKHLAEDEYGDVVLSEIREYVIGDMSNLAALDLQSGLLQCLPLGTLDEVFAILKMSTWEGPLPYKRSQS